MIEKAVIMGSGYQDLYDATVALEEELERMLDGGWTTGIKAELVLIDGRWRWGIILDNGQEELQL